MSRIKKFPGIRGLPGTFDAFDVFDDVEDVEDDAEDVATPSPHDVVMNFLNAQKRDDTLKIGRQTFLVKYANGGTVYVTKSPGAGRKLYTLKPVQFEPVIEFIVDEVSGGSGKSLGNPPAARFTLNADGKLAGVGAQIARVSVYDDDEHEHDAPREQQYPVERERMVLAGLDEPPAYERTPQAQDGSPSRVDPGKRSCTSEKLPFAYLRFDTCVTPRKDVKELPPIVSSRDAVKILRGSVNATQRGREFFMVLCLNARNQPIGVTVPHIGGRTFSMVELSVLLQAVLLSGATSFLVAHNHPSEDPTPSPEDIEITQQILEASKLIKVKMVDHIVMVGDGRYTSFLDNGLLKMLSDE